MQGEGAVTEESARLMLKRGLKQDGAGFVFTRDLRHRIPSLYGLLEEYLEEFAKNISCPHLLIKVVGGRDQFCVEFKALLLSTGLGKSALRERGNNTEISGNLQKE